jgi:hypothetical protein
MAAPAITAVIDAIIAKLEAAVPVSTPAVRFRRGAEGISATTRQRREFDLDFLGTADLSNDLRGVLNPGVSDVSASFLVSVAYPIGLREKALETVLAQDAESLRRAVSRSADWSGTPIQRMTAFRSYVDRSGREAVVEEMPGVFVLKIEATFRFRDTE